MRRVDTQDLSRQRKAEHFSDIRAAEDGGGSFHLRGNLQKNKHKICAKVRKIIQRQDFLSKF